MQCLFQNILEIRFMLLTTPSKHDTLQLNTIKYFEKKLQLDYSCC